MKTRDACFTCIMVMIDCMGIIAVATLARSIAAKIHLTPLFKIFFGQAAVNVPHDLFVIAVPLFMIFFFYEELYFSRSSFWTEFTGINKAGFFGSIVLALISTQIAPRSPDAYLFIVLMFLLAIVCMPLLHIIGKALLFRVSYFKKRVIVIARKDTNGLIPLLKKVWYLGYDIIGTAGMRPCVDTGIPFLGSLVRLPSVIHEQRCDIAFIYSDGIGRAALNDIIHRSEQHVQSITLVPDIGMIKTLSIRPEHINETLLFHISNNLGSATNRFVKIGMDVVVSGILLLLLLPLLVVCAVCIKIDSRGPVLYTQKRIGRNGRMFEMFKFRSMYIDGDKRLAAFLAAHPERRAEWRHYKKLRGADPRVTRIGRVLRRFSIDEIPQILNVLLGHMSIVGPRPYLQRERTVIGRNSALIFKVKPGLTGLWQVRGRNDLSFATRLKLDEFYVRNWSFLLDYLILAKTVKVVLQAKGAY